MRQHQFEFLRQHLLAPDAVEFELGDRGSSKTMLAAELLVAGYLTPLAEDADQEFSPTRLRYRLTPRGLAAYKAILSETGDQRAPASASNDIHNVGSERSAGPPLSASNHRRG
jgi:hypothetical protein